MDHWQPVTGNRPTSLPPLPRKLDRAAVVEYTRGLAPLCKPGVRRLKYFGQQQWTHRPDRHAVFTCGAEAEVKPGSERRIRSGVISRASSRPSPRQSVAEAPSVRSSQKASSKTLRAVKAAYQAESRAPSPVSEEGVEIGGQEAQERREMLQRQQLREMRTGDDAVSYFTRYGANTKVKLIHCILASGHSPTQEVSPYDLLVVPEDRIKRETGEYFTITASGVVHFMPGQLSECVSLSEWVHQCMMYRVLKSMSFFRLYLHRKAIAHWRQNARDAAFCRKRARLSRGCFFARPTLISPMLKVKALASEVGASTMVALPEQCTRLEDFEMATATSGEDGIRQELERRRESMVLALEELIATIRRSSDQLSKRKASMAATRSIAKEKLEAKERFRMEQIVHEDDAAARSCVRLADCLLQANLVASVTQTAEEPEVAAAPPGAQDGDLASKRLHLWMPITTRADLWPPSLPLDKQGHRVLDAASVWLREGSRDGKRVLDRKNMNSTYGGSLSARSLDKMSDPAQKIVVASGALTSREMRRIAEEEAVPGNEKLTKPLSVEERKLLELVQSMAAKAAQRFPSMSDVFRGLDPDRDGKIDRGELRYFFRTCGQTDLVADMFWNHLDRSRNSEFLDYDLWVSFLRPFLVAAYSGKANARPGPRGNARCLDQVKEDFAELLAAVKQKAKGSTRPRKAFRCIGVPGRDHITITETRAFFRCFNLDTEEVDAFHDALAQIGAGEVGHELFNEALEDCFAREPDYGSFRIPQKKSVPAPPPER
ncbi:unnamed protein product, partial [Effrenium voratum]